MGFKMKDDAVMELFKEVDTDDSGKIDINEFINVICPGATTVISRLRHISFPPLIVF